MGRGRGRRGQPHPVDAVGAATLSGRTVSACHTESPARPARPSAPAPPARGGAPASASAAQRSSPQPGARCPALGAGRGGGSLRRGRSLPGGPLGLMVSPNTKKEPRRGRGGPVTFGETERVRPGLGRGRARAALDWKERLALREHSPQPLFQTVPPQDQKERSAGSGCRPLCGALQGGGGQRGAGGARRALHLVYLRGGAGERARVRRRGVPRRGGHPGRLRSLHSTPLRLPRPPRHVSARNRAVSAPRPAVASTERGRNAPPRARRAAPQSPRSPGRTPSSPRPWVLARSARPRRPPPRAARRGMGCARWPRGGRCRGRAARGSVGRVRPGPPVCACASALTDRLRVRSDQRTSLDWIELDWIQLV